MTKNEFHNLFEGHYNDYCRYAFTILKNAEEAEDIVQGVFVDVWNSGKIHEIDRPEHYILRAIKFKCVDFQRKQIVKRKHEAEVVHLSSELEKSKEDNTEELLDILNAAIEELPVKTKEVFKKAKLEGKSYKDIAEEMGISPKTVENQMTRAFKQLRETAEKYKGLLGLLLFLIFE